MHGRLTVVTGCALVALAILALGFGLGIPELVGLISAAGTLVVLAMRNWVESRAGRSG